MDLIGYALCLDIADCTAMVLVNDWPVGTFNGSYPIKACPPVSESVINGQNRFEVIIMSASANTAPKLRVSFETCPLGAYPGKGKGDILATIEWPKPGEGFADLPKEINTTCSIKQSLGHWAWQDCQLLTLDKKTIAEATDFLRKMHAYLEKKDISSLAKIYEIKLKEMGHCYGMTFEEATTEFVDGLEEDFGDSEFKVSPLQPEQFDFKLRGDGRAIELCNRDGKSALRAQGKPENGKLYYDVFLGRIHEKIAVVR